MSSPLRPWDANTPLQNSTHFQRCTTNGLPTPSRSAPVLPPMPRSNNMMMGAPSAYNSYMPYSNGLGYGGMGAMPYRYGMMGGYGMAAYPDDAERRFIQYAEESSRNTFANVESIVRAVNSISMMLDNTFFAMTSSFRAVLSVADNFGKLRSMFGHIWHSVSVFRLFSWLYRRFNALLGRKSAASSAWSQAAGAGGAGGGASWPTLAFLGVLVSAPYLISKFLPKYEDRSDPAQWKSPGVRAKAAFEFVGRGGGELGVQVNDEVTLAPTYVQEEMGLKSSGWAFAVGNGKAGVVPLNYLLICKKGAEKGREMPVPREHHHKGQKRVSFGENQVFENVDLEDYVTGKKELKPLPNSDKVADDHDGQNNNK